MNAATGCALLEFDSAPVALGGRSPSEFRRALCGWAFFVSPVAEIVVLCVTGYGDRCFFVSVVAEFVVSACEFGGQERLVVMPGGRKNSGFPRVIRAFIKVLRQVQRGFVRLRVDVETLTQ